MAALLEAQKSLGGISKDKFNEFSKYKYTSSEHLVSVARRVLLTNGLVVGRRNWSFEESANSLIRTSLPSEESKDSQLLNVRSKFFVSHPASGECFEEDVFFPAIIRKGTTPDKAICASLSTALAYWLRDILLLPRIDDPYSMEKRNDNISKLNKNLTKEDTHVN